jgi:hypothetical protein
MSRTPLEILARVLRLVAVVRRCALTYQRWPIWMFATILLTLCACGTSEAPAPAPTDVDGVRHYLAALAAQDPAVAPDKELIERIVTESPDPVAVVRATWVFADQGWDFAELKGAKDTIIDAVNRTLPNSEEHHATAGTLVAIRLLILHDMARPSDFAGSLQHYVNAHKDSESEAVRSHVSAADQLLQSATAEHAPPR